jgi:hypothetical protein
MTNLVPTNMSSLLRENSYRGKWKMLEIEKIKKSLSFVTSINQEDSYEIQRKK